MDKLQVLRTSIVDDIEYKIVGFLDRLDCKLFYLIIVILSLNLDP